MSDEPNKNPLSLLQRAWRYSWQLVLSLAIVAGGLTIALLLASRRPEPAKAEQSEVATLVRTIVAKSSREQVEVSAFGTVQQRTTMSLTPEVSGRVIEKSEKLIVGGIFEAGERILRIDPRDFEAIVSQEEANVARAELDLKLELGRKVVAEREWELLDPDITATEIGRDLALRKPQLVEKEAALEAAKARLSKAQLDLKRTEIKAPFGAQVLTESVGLGQVVGPATPVATLVSTGQFRVQVSLPMGRLQWVRLPQQQGELGADALIIQELGRGARIERQGRVAQLLADVDPQGRMARLQIAVEDPLGLRDPALRHKALLIGSYVEARIQGPVLEKVFRVPRTALREGARIWVKNDQSRLEIRPVTILYGYEDEVLVSEGLVDGDELVTSTIPLPIPGMLLRSEEADASKAPAEIEPIFATAS